MVLNRARHSSSATERVRVLPPEQAIRGHSLGFFIDIRLFLRQDKNTVFKQIVLLKKERK